MLQKNIFCGTFVFQPYTNGKNTIFFGMVFYIKKSVFLQPQIGRGVAQLVARYVRDVEAGSSSLLTPTITGKARYSPCFFFLNLLLPIAFCLLPKKCIFAAQI